MSAAAYVLVPAALTALRGVRLARCTDDGSSPQTRLCHMLLLLLFSTPAASSISLMCGGGDRPSLAARSQRSSRVMPVHGPYLLQCWGSECGVRGGCHAA